MIDRDDLNHLHRATQAAVRGAQEELAAFMQKASGWPPDDLRDGLLEVMQAIVTKYGDAAASAAAEWYQQVRADALPGQLYTPVTAPAPPPTQVEGSVRAAAGHLYQGDPAMTERILAGALQRYVTGQSRGTVTANALHDPKARRFARVPRGVVTCAFCRTLASRGFVYTTAKEAGALNKFHDRCDCQVVPGFSDDPPKIDGYDPEALYKDYTEARNAAIKAGIKNPSVEDIAARMRIIHADKVSDGNGAGKSGIRLPLGRGSVTVPDGAFVAPHELRTARTLAEHGLHVTFRKQIYDGRKNPDTTIDGDIWEFKAPTGSSENNTISGQFKRAGKQSSNFVLDLRRCGLDDSVTVPQALRRFFGHKSIEQMLIIEHSDVVTKYSRLVS